MKRADSAASKKNKKNNESNPIGRIPDTSGSQEELIQANIKWSRLLYEQNKIIKRRLTAMVIGNYIRLAIIIAPLVLAIIYLPPLFRDLADKYGNLLNTTSGSQYTSISEAFRQFMHSLEQPEESAQSSGMRAEPRN